MLPFQAQRKVDQLTLDAHWTWASDYNNMQDLENPSVPLFWSRDAFTSRHRAVINTIWSLPVGKGKRFLGGAPAAIDHVLGGWRLYWITISKPDSPFRPVSRVRTYRTRTRRAGFQIVSAAAISPPKNAELAGWFDLSAFAVPPKGRFGNSGQNILEVLVCTSTTSPLRRISGLLRTCYSRL